MTPTLSAAVRARMAEKNWNADRLAEEAELARSTVFEILDGHDDVRVATLRKLKRVGVRHPLVLAA